MPDHVVAYPEKLLKTIATICAIFSLKFTKNRLAAGLRPDPLGELKRSPRPLSRGGEWERRGEGEKKERRNGRGEKVKGRARREETPQNFTWIDVCGL